MPDSSKRRKFLCAVGAGILGVSGCLRLKGDRSEATGRSNRSTRPGTTLVTTDVASTTTRAAETEQDTTETESTTNLERERTLSVSGSWPKYQFDDANTGNHPDTSGPSGSLELAWQFSTEQTDEREWRNFNPVVADGSLYFSSQDGYVYSLDATSGAIEWRFSKKGSSSQEDRRKCTPTVADGTVYAEGSGGSLYALDAESGSEEWALEQRSGAQATTPTVVNNTIYVSWGRLYALDGNFGARKWSRGGTITSTAFGNETLYVARADAKLAAHDPETGEILWSVDGPTTKPTYADGTVYAAVGRPVDDGEPTLYAVTESGEIRWKRALPGTISGVAAPVVADGKVLMGTKESESLHAFSTRDGTEQWSYNAGGWVSAPPTVVGDNVYMGGQSQELHCVALDDGTERWTQFLPSTAFSPTVLDGNVFLGTSTGDVIAFTDGS